MTDGSTRILERIRDLVFPPDIYCISCGRPTGRGTAYGLCDHCVRRFHWVDGSVCGICGRPLPPEGSEGVCSDCGGKVRSFEKGYTCARYGDRERDLLHRLKYGGRAYTAPLLARLIAERLECDGVEADLVVPVPMHPGKERERGYNQAELLACALADRMELPLEKRLLIRARTTLPMSRLSADEREAACRDLYRAVPGAEGRLGGRTVLLIDDIFTTGSTADACSRALLEAGASAVRVATFAAGSDPAHRINKG